MEKLKITVSAKELAELYAKLRYEGKVSSQVEFGEKLGYKKSFTSQILNGTSSVPPDVLDKVKQSFGVYPEDWIHEFSSGASKDAAKLPGHIIGEHYNKNETRFVELSGGYYLMDTPHVTVKARAGYLTGWGDDEYISELPVFSGDRKTITSWKVYELYYFRG